MSKSPISLTDFSHGAGCGCKISPEILSKILGKHHTTNEFTEFDNLVVGNESNDDAAAIKINDKQVILSTTDFFMPIVDDPFDFGRIAATNAISDIYAMGGNPLLAIAILGWPVDKLSAYIAKNVMEGGREVCRSLKIPLAGGHSIDAPEPFFGLAVTGMTDLDSLKKNDSARAGDILILTKPIGVGLLTTAEKQGKLDSSHAGIATQIMCQPNTVGAALGGVAGINAMTDVTGFGLAGHLVEICEGANLSAQIDLDRVPLVAGADKYIELGCIPGGTERNFQSTKGVMPELDFRTKVIIFDPQTSGGLLISVSPSALAAAKKTLDATSLSYAAIGKLAEVDSTGIRIKFK